MRFISARNPRSFSNSMVNCNRDSARALWEIAFIVICVLIAEWVVIPVFGRRSRMGLIPIGVVLVFALFSHFSRRETPRVIGFTHRGFLRALRLLLVWMIPASLALVAIGWLQGTLHYSLPQTAGAFVLGQFWLFLWGLLQQYALQSIINRRAQEIWGKGWLSVLIVALIFAGCHLPNALLMCATFAGGILWASVYQKAPNLFALALSHSIMTSILAISTDPAVIHGLRVGYNYY